MPGRRTGAVVLPADRTGRVDRVSATRASILLAAERLFAEHGVIAVSNRQISEAAGQGNNTAVGYHFGTKAGLIRAIVRKHAEQIELARQRMVARTGDSTDLRDWIGCLVRPTTAHLDELGSPTWYARCIAQVMSDPALREIAISESLTAPTLQQAVEGLNRCLPELPAQVRAERDEMTRHLILQVSAERERALAEGTPAHRSTWHDTATGLIDAIAGMLLAPVAPA